MKPTVNKKGLDWIRFHAARMGLWWLVPVLSLSMSYAGEVPIPEMVSIPEGEYTIGAPDGIEADLLPLQHSARQTVSLAPYEIGRCEVMNAEYAAFMRQGGYQNPFYWSEEAWKIKERFGWRRPQVWLDKRYWQSRDRDEEEDRKPVVGVSWYEARAYCRWLSAKTGLRYDLPTEEQWEVAARGPQGFLWPWGNRWDPKRCNSADDTDGNCQGDGTIDGYDLTAPTGTYPQGASPFGCRNMAGNAREWCLNRFVAKGPESAYRVLRGGSWMTISPRNLTTIRRGGAEPWIRFVFWGTIGFRVVRLIGNSQPLRP